MEEITRLNSNSPVHETKKSKKDALKKRWLLALYFCGFGGILIGLVGLFLSGLAYFEYIEKGQQVHKTGTVLIVISFPFIMLGAHALDRIFEIDHKKTT